MEFADLLERLDVADVESNFDRDILKHAPALSITDAYRLQFGLMDRRSARNDLIVGYQASYTSAAMKKLNPSFPAPLFGTLLRSNLKHDNLPLPISGTPYGVEAEIGVVLKRDLEGPDVTLIEAHRSIECIFAAIECAAPRPRDANGNMLTSPQHLIATHNTKSMVVCGSKMVKPTFDLRLEGVALSVNGNPFSSATGQEAMGSPINVVIAIANWLAAYDRGLKAGQILITGALPTPTRISQPGTSVLVEFATLGSVFVHI